MRDGDEERRKKCVQDEAKERGYKDRSDRPVKRDSRGIKLDLDIGSILESKANAEYFSHDNFDLMLKCRPYSLIMMTWSWSPRGESFREANESSFTVWDKKDRCVSGRCQFFLLRTRCLIPLGEMILKDVHTSSIPMTVYYTQISNKQSLGGS